MEGRRTGTPGAEKATAYVARAFADAGLEPAGDAGTWFQTFDFTSGVSLAEGNALRVEGAGEPAGPFAVDRDWRPMVFSRSGGARGPVAFAGYGIVAPAGDGVAAYDSYAGLDVRDKWVLALRFLPEDVAPEVRQHLSVHGSLRYKAMVARDRGALGLVLVSGPRSRVREPLVPLRLDAAVGATSLLAISASDNLGASLLEGTEHSLAGLQRVLDSGEPVPGFVVPEVQLEVSVALVQEQGAGRNVLGRLKAGSEGRAPVVIGAHVDHLGREAGETSLAHDRERDAVHRGADDNASGVAALIEIAWSLVEAVRQGSAHLERDIVFAAWSGEEMGLLGSEAFAAGLPEAAAHGAPAVAAYLNMDMVGRLRHRLLLYGVSSSSIWPSEIERANQSVGLPVSLQSDAFLPTDATSFHLKGVPTLTAFTGSHGEYHTPRDRPELLNYEGLAEIARLVEAVALSLAERSDAPDFVPSQRPEHLGQRAALRAWLGTVPSYAESPGPGLALSGVTGGGPADAAGLRRGDRVVELAGRRIENLYDYTYAIEALRIGEPVRIVVEREGRRLELAITPQSRQ
jgi:hypothetical protein